MSDERAPDSTSQISVAELLARNGRSSATGNGRRRRGGAGSIPVAELTGELPVVDTTVPGRANPHFPTSYPLANLADAPRTESPPVEPSRARFADPVVSPPAPPVRPNTWDVPTAGWSMDPPAGHTRRVSGTDISGNDIRTDRFPAIVAGAANAGGASPASLPASPLRSGRSAPPAETEADSDTDSDDSSSGRAARRRNAGPLRQWLSLGGQVIVAVIVGALQFKGFEELWDTLPVVALVLSVLVVLALVALVRVVRRTDDLLSTVIAIVVGICVTIGPLVFLLSSG